MNPGVIFIGLFVVAAAFRDVYFGNLFQRYEFLEVVLVAFSVATVIFGLIVAVRMPAQGRAIMAAWRETIAANLGTAAAWLSFFYALKSLEPAIVNTIHTGFGSVTLVGLGMIGVKMSGAARVTRAERLFTLGIFLSLLLLASVVILQWSGLRGGGAADNVLGLALAFASGAFIALSTDITKRMNAKGVAPEAVLAVRFIAIVVISAAVLFHRGAGTALADPISLASLAIAALILIVGPLYLLQIGIARTSAVSVWILLAPGPCFVFAAQLLDGRLVYSPHTLAGVVLYSVCALGGALSRKYERNAARLSD